MGRLDPPATPAPVRPGALSSLLRELVSPAESPPAADAFRPGMTVGRFELVRELGRGGFGVVFEARDRELGRLVALKTVAGAGASGARPERLLREAEAVARLSHPNIVTLHDVGRDAHVPYLVLELLRGETLAARLRRGRLPLREALRVGVAVASGLAHAHASGVVHRDLTPANVFLCEDRQVKVLDLGLAHVFGVRKLDGGTGRYMAPEQERGAPEDERTDVYALGVILGEALAGEALARSGRPALEIPELPALAELLVAMTAADPVDRPRDAAAVLDRLRQVERELAASGSAREPSARLAPPAPAATLAVLPFADLGQAHDQEWLCDGIAEEIIHALAGLRGIRVVSRSASFRFRGSALDIREVAEALGASALLEGSVRRFEERVRVTARLLGKDGFEVWSESFDRVLDDVFAIQSEIACAVATRLEVPVSPGEARRLRRVGTSNARAFELFLEARRHPVSCNKHGVAAPLLREAIALDPRFAEAHAALADIHFFVLQWHGGREDAAVLRREAAVASETALRLEPSLAEAHVAHANLLALAGRRDGAEVAYREAITLNPGLAEAWFFFGRFFLTTGRPEAATGPLEEAALCDPDNYGCFSMLRQAYLQVGDAERASAANARALAACERWVRNEPGDAVALVMLGIHLLDVGLRARARDVLARALELGPDVFGVRYYVACGLARLGEREHAIELLESTLSPRDGFRGWIERDTDLDALRDEPRVQALLAALPR